jgi:hypothetical protein
VWRRCLKRLMKTFVGLGELGPAAAEAVRAGGAAKEPLGVQDNVRESSLRRGEESDPKENAPRRDDEEDPREEERETFGRRLR